MYSAKISVTVGMCNTLSSECRTCRCEPRQTTGLGCAACLAKLCLPAVAVTGCPKVKMLLQRDIFTQIYSIKVAPKDPS